MQPGLLKFHTNVLLAICLLITGSCFSALATSAPLQSKIVIQNDTAYDFTVAGIETSGDPLNKKAWKPGVTDVPRGTRQSVLTLNRSGKVNWMDPTPRFIEPGKTAVFAVHVAAADPETGNAITLKLKLFGTGKSSKMWHAIEVAGEETPWQLDDAEITGAWSPTDSINIKFAYSTFTEKGETHVRYVFSTAVN